MVGWSPKAALGEIHPLLWNAGLQPSEGIVWCVTLSAIAFLAPNSNRIGTKALRIAREQPRMRAMIGGAALCATLLLVLVNASRNSVSAFICFNF